MEFGNKGKNWQETKVRKIKKLCLICKKEFLSCRNRGKFCSKKCYGKWRSKNFSGRNHPNWKGGKDECICKNCQKKFLIAKCEIKRSGGKFCSSKCYGVWKSKNLKGKNNPRWKGGLEPRRCKICEKKFYVKLSTVKRKQGKFCSKCCSSVYTAKHSKKKNTSIEIKVEDMLKQLGIKYESQKVIPECRTVADFYIPGQRLVIYADGDYWHSLLGCKDRDCKQDFLLGINSYKVLRLSENEINNSPKQCINKIKGGLKCITHQKKCGKMGVVVCG